MIKGILTELKKTKWPTGKEILVMTIYTLIVCAIIAGIMVVLDLGFAQLRDWFLKI